jgi:hypothetical protein
MIKAFRMKLLNSINNFNDQAEELLSYIIEWDVSPEETSKLIE